MPEAAIRIFELNAESYPESWRVYNALGDGYMEIGQPTQAIEAFQRSLEINPENANAADKLRKLREKD